MTAQLSRNGTVQGFQVGPADLLASTTLATCLWNRFGGLSTLLRALQYAPGLIRPQRVQELEFTPQDLPATSHILTPDGIGSLDDDDPADCFGGDPRTQLIGFTICALSHLFGRDFAVRIFMKCMVPALLEASVGPGIKEELFAQLTDNAARIIDEGVSRSLPARFEEAIKDVDLPTSKFAGTEDRNLSTDDYYIGGLLRWITQRRRSHYLTRSADVIRVAACLRRVGWLTGPIRICSNDRPPTAYDGVTLITSGFHQTDTLATDEDDNLKSEGQIDHIHHYRNETVGPMLFLASRGMSEMSPESMQTDFLRINSYIRKRLRFTWVVERHDEDGLGPSLHAKPHWTKDSKSANRLSVTLACMFFQAKTAENVAECFQALASETVLKEIRAFEESSNEDFQPACLEHWKIIVICIILSIAEQLGGKDYSKLGHATQLDLYRTCSFSGDTALQILSGLLRGFEHGLESGAVLRLLAICHGGLSLSGCDTSDTVWNTHVIGYQGSGYTVLPNLLFDMSVGQDSIGFRCDNRVFGNLPASEADGHIETLPSDNWASFSTGTEDGGSQSIVHGASFYVSEPHKEPPDAPLYLNFERGRVDYAPLLRHIAVVGRIHGEIIGVSGIFDIMVTMVNSLSNRRDHCPGHSEPAKALVIKASTWMAKRYKRPMDGTNQFHTYIPVKGSQPWVLFLAGQIMGIDGRICFGCYDCTLQADNRHPSTPNTNLDAEDEYPRVVIGF
jgi:hypothetical protein